MKQILLAQLFFIISTLSLFAQNKTSGSIHGTIEDEGGNPVPFVTLMLLDTDSALVKADFSKDDGSFVFEHVAEGMYLIQLRSIQYDSKVSEIIELGEGDKLEMDPIKVRESVTKLEEVKITATKPLVEIHPDKTIFNVASSPGTAGTDGLEMLRKAPGIIIDNNDNIILQGKSGVKVYIDGKPSHLSGEDLVNMLRSLQSDGVESVDIITNPSAKYEAEGNAGILDIRLKRDHNLGLKSTISANYNVGRFAGYSGGADFNYRNKKLNVFGNYNYHDRKGYWTEAYIKLIKDSFLDQSTESIWDRSGHGFRLGTDYLINKNHLVGFVINGNINSQDMNTVSTTPFGNQETGIIVQRLDAISVRVIGNDNINSNLNYVYTGSKGAKLNIDTDYGYFFKEGVSNQSNVYYDVEDETMLNQNLSEDQQLTRIDISAIKADYEKSIWIGNLSLGTKVSNVTTDNSLEYYNVVEGKPQIDINKSNDFIYSEKIIAGYISYNGKINDKLSFNSGLRMEHTSSRGELEGVETTDKNNVERSYADIFPSGGVAFSLSKKHKLSANYSRRIDRPSYESLNPFEFQLDELTFRRGNPFLNPQYTDSYKLSHSFDQKLNTEINYSMTHDYFAQILDTTGERGSMISVQNMTNFKQVGLNVNYSMDITKKWSFYTNGNLYKSFYKSENAGTQINLSAATLNVYAKTNIILPSDINFEVSGWYNSPSIWGGTFRMEGMWSVDAGVRKTFWDNKASVKISVSDIFKTNNWKGVSNYGGIHLDGGGVHDSRQLRFSLTYQLGNQQVKGSRARATGLEEEKNRVESEQ